LREILIAEEHDQVYRVLLERRVQNIAIAHIDFHCDMRGLMIDRLRGVAYMVSRYEAKFIDDGNFLSHAIMNGLVSSIRWIHDPFGGRRHDFVGCVRYESDFTAAVHGVLHRLRGGNEVSIAFEESSFRDWDGVRPGEYLDLDWDALASIYYQPSYIRKLMDNFLNREFVVIPETTFLVYSPGYSYQDRNMFERFAASLKEKFSARIVRLPKPIKGSESSFHDWSFPWRAVRCIRRNWPKPLMVLGYKILARLSAHDTRHDLDHQLRS
jgi:hypothetical protein